MADTQSMPALVKALNGILPDTAVRSLMQALGNCNQPYASRSSTNIQPAPQTGNKNGVYSGGAWNPADYQGLLPTAGSPGAQQTQLPGMGGYTNGDWNSVNYGGNQFYFPTDNTFNLNNFYGGPVFNVGGNTSFVNQSVVNQNVTNLTVTNTFTEGVNGIPFAPDPEAGDPTFPGGGGIDRGGNPGNPFVIPTFIPFGPPNRRPTDWTPMPMPRVPSTGKGKVRIVKSATLGEDCKIDLVFSTADITVTLS